MKSRLYGWTYFVLRGRSICQNRHLVALRRDALLFDQIFETIREKKINLGVFR